MTLFAGLLWTICLGGWVSGIHCFVRKGRGGGGWGTVHGAIISHLQFADDTLLFCNVNREKPVSVRVVFRCFKLVSGLKVNLNKSLVGWY